MDSFFVNRFSIMSLVNPITAHKFSILNISLNMGNHLWAFSSKVLNRDISLSLASSSWLCILWRLRICLLCCSCICCIWIFNSSVALSRLVISWCSCSMWCSSSFSLPLPKREPTPLAMAVAALVAVFFCFSLAISSFIRLCSCSARLYCFSLCRLCSSIRFRSSFFFPML